MGSLSWVCVSGDGQTWLCVSKGMARARSVNTEMVVAQCKEAQILICVLTCLEMGVSGQ